MGQAGGQPRAETRKSSDGSSEQGAGRDLEPRGEASLGSGAEDEIQRLMEETRRALRESAHRPAPGPELRPFPVPDFGEPSPPEPEEDEKLSSTGTSDLPLRVEWGRRTLPKSQAGHWGAGDVVPMDKEVGEPVEIYAGQRLVARGEVVVREDTVCVQVTELVPEDVRTPARRAG